MTRRLSLAILPLLATSALAQSPEYRMDPQGNWVQISAPQSGTDEAVFAAARKELAEDRPADAEAIISPWIDANDRTKNPRLAEALVIRGDALTAQGNEYDALYDYERSIKEFPGSKSFVTAVERELDIGVRYLNGLKRKLFGARLLEATDIGEELLIRVQERMPGSRAGERAGIELADYYYRDHDLTLAVEMYDLFIQNYPNSQYKQRAMQRRIYATIARFKGPKYDGSALIDAKILTRRYMSLYPAEAEKAGLDDGLLTRLDESSGQDMLETANWYLKRNDEVSARFVMRRLVRDHPRTAAAKKALDFIQSKGWPIQVGAENRPAAKPVEPDFERGEAGVKVEDDKSDKPSAPTQPPASQPAQPSAPDGAKQPAPGLSNLPVNRPPPVELRRRVPQPAPGSQLPASEQGQPTPATGTPPPAPSSSPSEPSNP